jgi:hypothetical protein
LIDGTVSAIKSRSGFGLLEVMIASALGLMLFTVITYLSHSARKSSNLLNDSNACHAFAQNVHTILESSNAKIKVRNWAPTKEGERRAPGDTIDQFSFNSQGQLLNDRFFNSQNILDTTNWALAQYNNHNPAICRDAEGRYFIGEGITQFLSKLPEPIERPPGLERINLFVKQRDLASVSMVSENCTDRDIEAHPKLNIAFSIQMNFEFKHGELISKCETSYLPQFSSDDERPIVKAGFRNSDNVSFNPGGNSCQRDCAKDGEIDNQKLPYNQCDERHSVTMAIQTEEPGSLIFCRRSGDAWGDLKDENYRDCNQVGHQFTLISSEVNSKMHVEFLFPGLRDNPNESYKVDVLAVDTGGNPVEERFEFWVFRPPCATKPGCPPGEKMWKVSGQFICVDEAKVPDCPSGDCKIVPQ